MEDEEVEKASTILGHTLVKMVRVIIEAKTLAFASTSAAMR